MNRYTMTAVVHDEVQMVPDANGYFVVASEVDLTVDALRAQLAALAEEYEALTVSHTIKAANLALLVEKVLDYHAAIDEYGVCGSDSDAEVETAREDMIDLARSLENKP